MSDTQGAQLRSNLGAIFARRGEHKNSEKKFGAQQRIDNNSTYLNLADPFRITRRSANYISFHSLCCQLWFQRYFECFHNVWEHGKMFSISFYKIPIGKQNVRIVFLSQPKFSIPYKIAYATAYKGAILPIISMQIQKHGFLPTKVRFFTK